MKQKKEMRAIIIDQMAKTLESTVSYDRFFCLRSTKSPQDVPIRAVWAAEFIVHTVESNNWNNIVGLFYEACIQSGATGRAKSENVARHFADAIARFSIGEDISWSSYGFSTDVDIFVPQVSYSPEEVKKPYIPTERQVEIPTALRM